MNKVIKLLPVCNQVFANLIAEYVSAIATGRKTRRE